MKTKKRRVNKMLQRNEYPRPQFQRNKWSPLNIEWEFYYDDGDE